MNEEEFSKKKGLSPAKGIVVGMAFCAAFYAAAFLLARWLFGKF